MDEEMELTFDVVVGWDMLHCPTRVEEFAWEISCVV